MSKLVVSKKYICSPEVHYSKLNFYFQYNRSLFQNTDDSIGGRYGCVCSVQPDAG